MISKASVAESDYDWRFEFTGKKTLKKKRCQRIEAGVWHEEEGR